MHIIIEEIEQAKGEIGGVYREEYLNIMMPPMKVTHKAAPKAVEKQRR